MIFRPPYSYGNLLVFVSFFGGQWADLIMSDNIISDVFTEEESGTPEWIMILFDDFDWKYP